MHTLTDKTVRGHYTGMRLCPLELISLYEHHFLAD